MNLDERISTTGIKKKLRSGGDYNSYLGKRLPDQLSPREFYEWGNRVIGEIASGQSSDPTKPVPANLHEHSQRLHGFLLITLYKLYCPEFFPPEFAQAVTRLFEREYNSSGWIF